MKKLIVAVAALALMASSAYAAEWNFYGVAKIYTGWYQNDLIGDGDDSGDYYDTQYTEGLYTTAKIGAMVKVSDELTGRFEYGTKGGSANIRQLYGEWDFGAGTLLVGQSYTPLNVSYSSQIVDNDLGLEGYGDLYNSRKPEIMLTFGGFSIAFINPEKDAWITPNFTNDDVGGYYTTQAVIPMIAACFKADLFDMGEVQIAGGYNTFEINDDEDVDAYAVAIGGNLNFGPLGVFATAMWGQNIGNLAASNESGYSGLAFYDGNEVFDNESMGGTIGVTFAFGDMLTLEAGYGYIHDDFDEDNVTTNIAQSYYLQAAITLAPGVTVTPEVGMIDQREDGLDETIYFGACWAIAF